MAWLGVAHRLSESCVPVIFLERFGFALASFCRLLGRLTRNIVGPGTIALQPRGFEHGAPPLAVVIVGNRTGG